eukprot:1600331-Pyramimonas_sp.AAC.2
MRWSSRVPARPRWRNKPPSIQPPNTERRIKPCWRDRVRPKLVDWWARTERMLHESGSALCVEKVLLTQLHRQRRPAAAAHPRHRMVTSMSRLLTSSSTLCHASIAIPFWRGHATIMASPIHITVSPTVTTSSRCDGFSSSAVTLT